MKILVVGLGSIAKKHIAAMNEIDAATEIWALRSSKNAEPYENVKNIYSWDEMPQGIDFIIISNPTTDHYKTIEKALEYRLPIFIEKPSLAKLSGANELLEKAESAGIITYVGCNLRFHPCINFIKEHIEKSQQKVNEVNCYCGSYLPDWRPGRDFKTIYSANAGMGGGVHLDLIHELDYTYWIFGAPEKVQSVIRAESSLKISAIDYANYTLVYPGFTASIILNYYRRDPKRTFELVFEFDTWLVDMLTCSIKNKDNKVIFKSEYVPMDSYISQLVYFTEKIKKHEHPMNSLRESMEVLKICLINEQVSENSNLVNAGKARTL